MDKPATAFRGRRKTRAAFARETGYLPSDKSGADLLFRLVSQRCERGSIIVTTNKAYKHWPSIFNNDAGTTAAILDRLLHRSETVLIEGRSCRMKDRLASPPSPPPELLPAVSGAPRSAAGPLRPMSKSHPPGFGGCLHREKVRATEH